MLGGEGVAGVVAGDGATAHGEVQVVASESCVAPGFGVAAGAHKSDAERGNGVAEVGGFAGAEDDADAWKVQAEGAEELDKIAVVERVGRFESAGGGAQSGEADGEVGFPAGAQEVVEVGGEGDGFFAPIPQAEEDADAETAEAGGVSALRAGEAPVVIFFWSGGVQAGVGRAMVSFVVDDEPLGAGAGEREVVRGLQRCDFDGERGDFRGEDAENFFEVAVGDELGVFAGDEEDVAETLRGEVAGFGADLGGLEGDSEDGVFAREAAVGATVDAFVGEIQRSEEADGFAEVAAGKGAGVAGHVLEVAIDGRCEGAGESGHGRGERQTQRGENLCRIGRRNERSVHSGTDSLPRFPFLQLQDRPRVGECRGVMFRGKPEMRLLTGTAHPKLARAIADYIGVPLGDATVSSFPDGETFVKINENVRGRDVFIIQPTCPPTNHNLMELLILVDAARRASAARITAVIPFFGYARQDRKDQPRVPITAKLVANLMVAAGVNRLLTMDLHAQQLQGFFDIPVDHLHALPVLIRRLREKKIDDLVVVSPDVGGVKMASAYAQATGAGLAIVVKRRISATETEAQHVIGDVKGKNVLLVDDLTETAGTLAGAGKILRAAGAKDIYAMVSHAVLTDLAAERLRGSEIKELITTDSVPVADLAGCRVEVCSVADLLGEGIKRIHDDESVTSLFEIGGPSA